MLDVRCTENLLADPLPRSATTATSQVTRAATAGPSVGSTSEPLSPFEGFSAWSGYARLINSRDPQPRTKTKDREQLRCPSIR